MARSAVTELEQQDNVGSTTPSNNGQLSKNHSNMANKNTSTDGLKKTEFLLDRNLHKSFPVVKSAKGNYLYLTDGRTVFDATSGAAVSCLGHGNQRVINAMSAQLNTGVPYLASTFWGSEVVEELCKELINGTEGKMARIYLTGSGKSSISRFMRAGVLTNSRLRGHGIYHQIGASILSRE